MKSHHRWGIKVTRKARKSQILRGHQRWQGVWGRLRREIARKFDSKLYKPSWMAIIGPAALELCSLATGGTQEMKEIAEILGPSQMAI